MQKLKQTFKHFATSSKVLLVLQIFFLAANTAVVISALLAGDPFTIWHIASAFLAGVLMTQIVDGLLRQKLSDLWSALKGIADNQQRFIKRVTKLLSLAQRNGELPPHVVQELFAAYEELNEGLKDVREKDVFADFRARKEKEESQRKALRSLVDSDKPTMH